MKKIILTQRIEDGRRLKRRLIDLDESFNKIECFNYSDLLNNPEKFKRTEFIFSTWFMPIMSSEEVSNIFPKLNSVFYSAGSVKYFANPFLINKVRVFSAAAANAIPVAEFVLAQILLANKGYFQSLQAYRWPFWKFSFKIARSYTSKKKGNFKAKIGIIGCGLVGSKVVELLKPFDLEVSVYDPYLSIDRIEQLNVKQESLENIFKYSDVISNHLPDNPQTYNILNYNVLSLMKDNATFINTGRGRQVVEKDLLKVMKLRPNACALLDVTKIEPLIPWSSIKRRKNIFITPHIAGSLSDELNRLVLSTYNSYQNVLINKADRNEVFIEDLIISA